MGGKIRTEGFHFPMSDFLQFVYTFTLPDQTGSSAYSNVSWKVELAEGYEDKLLFWKGTTSPEGSGVTIDKASSFLTGTTLAGQSFTFTNSLLDMQKPDGSIVTDAYRYGKDAFRIVLTDNETGRSTTLSYDLYHTGVFAYDNGAGNHQTGEKNDQGWYYYEVIQMGSNYWLDRNLGAKSSGYYMQDGNGGSLLGDGDWPLRDNSAGGLYCVAGAPPKQRAGYFRRHLSQRLPRTVHVGVQCTGCRPEVPQRVCGEYGSELLEFTLPVGQGHRLLPQEPHVL